MSNNVYNFTIDIDWKLIGIISQIDRFDATWSSIEKRETQSLKQLKSIATVLSVGASTRIEGSRLSDEEVDLLLQNIDITKLEDRDSQEVVGYFETFDTISESYSEINITESSLKYLHNSLMRFNKKDEWHKGEYKKHSNAVEANYPDGTKQLIFETTPAGFQTEDAMRNLVDWYNSDNETHPLVKCALFTYDFLSIHPFQDGNGRLSRLISSLLLLKNGYSWIQYISLEHEIETRKSEYYRVLRNCQTQRPNENVSEWTTFFFDAIMNVQSKLLKKLELSGNQTQLSPKEKSIITYIENHAGCKSSEISTKLNIPNPTVKRLLTALVNMNLITKHGTGPGTNYSAI
ncbi:Fic family protein [Algoriphagus marinus]|jgi:Fic family protein|uniref:Fic family protein n=1 Tax=Algoriphagus marinus TaxID=1925762 RepID=UPI00094B7A51|nr:Fic family protein [Algoriphagus marinus]